VKKIDKRKNGRIMRYGVMIERCMHCRVGWNHFESKFTRMSCMRKVLDPSVDGCSSCVDSVPFDMEVVT
jgi:hypothetical protein